MKLSLPADKTTCIARCPIGITTPATCWMYTCVHRMASSLRGRDEMLLAKRYYQDALPFEHLEEDEIPSSFLRSYLDKLREVDHLRVIFNAAVVMKMSNGSQFFIPSSYAICGPVVSSIGETIGYSFDYFDTDDLSDEIGRARITHPESGKILPSKLSVGSHAEGVVPCFGKVGSKRKVVVRSIEKACWIAAAEGFRPDTLYAAANGAAYRSFLLRENIRTTSVQFSRDQIDSSFRNRDLGLNGPALRIFWDESRVIVRCAVVVGTAVQRRSPISPRLRWSVLQRDGFKCRYCGAPSSSTRLFIDHARSIKDGGSNHPDNLVAACFPCNSGKGAMSIDPDLASAEGCKPDRAPGLVARPTGGRPPAGGETAREAKH